MGGKAKPTKHTAKEMAQKAKMSSCNMGGGTSGLKDRQGGAAGHAKLQCQICGQAAPDPTSAAAHWESKHKKMGAFDITQFQDKHAENGGVTTQGTAVRGKFDKKK